MVARLAAAHALPLTLLEQLAIRTDGVPLFVEELTKSVLESTASAGPGIVSAIPSTLQDSLMARLDRLRLGKPLAQIASVIGREFSRDLLAAITSIDADSLDAALGELTNAELVYAHGPAPHTTYLFKHALVQDVAYESMLRSARRDVHRRIAETLQSCFPERAKDRPELLAYHHERAGDLDPAIDRYEDAAQRAQERSAQHEVVAHLQRAIELRRPSEERPEHRRQAGRLHVALGARLLELRGYGDPEIETVYLRAIELCDADADRAVHFRALWGLSVFYQARTRLDEAVRLGRQLVEIAMRMEDCALALMAHQALGSPLLWQGRFDASLDSVGRALSLYQPELHQRLSREYGEDPGVSTRVYASQALWHLGFPDRALQTIRDGVALAEAGDHPFSLGYALGFLAAIHALRGEHADTAVAAQRTLQLAEQQDLVLWRSMGKFFLAWATSTPATSSSASAALEEAVAMLAATGTEVGAPFLLGMLADALLCCGLNERALQVVRAALGLAQARQSLFWNSALERVQGEALLAADATAGAGAEACFERALAIAREQGARSLALRAATRLAERRAARGAPADARDVLQSVYSTFQEGFAAPQLLEARALLDRLA
jgi:predicted ATPase